MESESINEELCKLQQANIKTLEEEILEKCDDINGFELLKYKKNYYLRNLETNELHEIIDFKPDNIIGYLTTSGKIKFK